VRLLIDTHALIWWWLGDAQLTARACAALADREYQVFVSSVSIIEVAIKVRRGQLTALAEPLRNLDRDFVDFGFSHLPVNHVHAREAGLLPGAHRDPFDRLLAAQALIEGLTVVSRDAEFVGFGCKVLW
jgi:PIN domain nuclease of toxin-antitoxin system